MSTTDPARPTEPEYLGNASSGSAPGRRTPLLLLAALGVVGVVVAGGWAALSLMSGTHQPASAVPTGALAYVSLDLDPSAAQKLEAIRIMKRFPALDEELGLDVQDDLRRWAFEELARESCPGASYDDDVARWVGKRIAFAVLPGTAKGGPVPMVALQVDDEGAATRGIADLRDCAGQDTLGFAFSGGYVVLAESQETADRLVREAAAASLAADADFTGWVEQAGAPGILTVYVAAAAPAALADFQRWVADQPSTGEPGRAGGPAHPGPPFGSGAPSWLGTGPAATEELQALAADFEGLAAVVRFEHGAVEAELAAGGLPAGLAVSESTLSGVAALPASTGAALSFAVPDGWLEDYLETVRAMSGAAAVESMLEEAESATGLSLPEDIEALFGESLSLVVDSGLDSSAVMRQGPSSVPAGIRVVGDPVRILPVVEKLKAFAGPEAELLVVEEGDSAVALGLDPAYVATLVGEGTLGDQALFRAVLPEADRAAGALFVNFDADDAWVQWLVAGLSPAVGAESGPRITENMTALEALGVSSWTDGDVQRGRFTLTTR